MDSTPHNDSTFLIYLYCLSYGASLVAQIVKNLHKAGDPGSIPGSGRSPEKGMGIDANLEDLEQIKDLSGSQLLHLVKLGS